MIVRSTDESLDWRAEGNARLVQNVRNILRTWQGEAAFNRPMGVNREALGKPIDVAARYLAQQIAENIAAYEPDVTVRAVNAYEDGLGRLCIEADIEF